MGFPFDSDPPLGVIRQQLQTDRVEVRAPLVTPLLYQGSPASPLVPGPWSSEVLTGLGVRRNRNSAKVCTRDPETETGLPPVIVFGTGSPRTARWGRTGGVLTGSTSHVPGGPCLTVSPVYSPSSVHGLD